MTRVLRVRTWWGTRRLSTEVLGADGGRRTLRVSFPDAGEVTFRVARGGYELVVGAALRGVLLRGGERVELERLCAHGRTVLPLRDGDAVALSSGGLRVDADFIERPARLPAAPLSPWDARWLRLVSGTVLASALCLAALQLERQRDPLGRPAAGLTPWVHLVVPAPDRGRARPPPTPAPAPLAPSGRALASLLQAVDVHCLCRPCWVDCREPKVSPPRALRCAGGACGDLDPLAAVVQSRRAQLRACVRAQAEPRTTPGWLAVTLDLAGGTVRAHVLADTADGAALARCVRSRLESWSFPPAADDAWAASFRLDWWWDFPS